MLYTIQYWELQYCEGQDRTGSMACFGRYADQMRACELQALPGANVMLREKQVTKPSVNGHHLIKKG